MPKWKRIYAPSLKRRYALNTSAAKESAPRKRLQGFAASRSSCDLKTKDSLHVLSASARNGSAVRKSAAPRKQDCVRRSSSSLRLRLRSASDLPRRQDLLSRSRKDSRKKRLARAEEERRAAREAEERRIEAERQAEAERIRREAEERAANESAAAPDTTKYTYTSKLVKLLFRKSVDPNITSRIHEIIKATIEYYGKEKVYLKIKASVPDTSTVCLEFVQIPMEEMELLSNIIKVLGNSGLGIAKAIVE